MNLRGLFVSLGLLCAANVGADPSEDVASSNSMGESAEQDSAVLDSAAQEDEIFRLIEVAGSHLVSLWPLRDEATAASMEGFYGRVEAGEPLAQALRQNK